MKEEIKYFKKIVRKRMRIIRIPRGYVGMLYYKRN